MTRSGRAIAVVIPALDEAACVAEAVRSAAGASHVIVADGGSSDSTVRVAREAGAEVIDAPRGRARQMNAGARSASDADVLLFLHADTTLPGSWRADVESVLARPGCVAGAFDFAVAGDRPRDRLVSACGSARVRLTRHPYGDQGLFLGRDEFDAVGGFPDQPMMEDWEIIRRLKRRGRIGIAPSAVRTSTRQWDEGGLLRSTAIYFAVISGYRLGVPHERLIRLWALGLDTTRAPKV